MKHSPIFIRKNPEDASDVDDEKSLNTRPEKTIKYASVFNLIHLKFKSENPFKLNIR